MIDERERIWETLFDRAVKLMNSARDQGVPVDDWTFGGGTVLMRRHRHRLSKDIDIFIGDPQFLGYLSPRLNVLAEKMTGGNYVEDRAYLKLTFAEGEIDFVAAGTITMNPAIRETVRDYRMLVETSAEVVAKKIWHRGAQFTARDIFDLSMFLELEPDGIEEIETLLKERRQVILERIERAYGVLGESFAALEILEYRRSFDECVGVVRNAMLTDG
ncbi:MAG: nucleotidyl transferase AbiEii/AbiGii toxin family protein [Steroidobacteraceae bacterium]|nr:nucleotidyl transferase AbiEii/AbiGii toxin family protein [Steroidobacteraceae bacterium]